MIRRQPINIPLELSHIGSSRIINFFMQASFLKSKSIFFASILIVIGLYFFGFANNSVKAFSISEFISSKINLTQGSENISIDKTTGNQVVTILRSLSVIKLDDSVFRNPAFGLLTDLSISLPPVTNQGRRNPFAPLGVDVVNAPVMSATQTGPSF